MFRHLDPSCSTQTNYIISNLDFYTRENTPKKESFNKKGISIELWDVQAP